MSRNFQLTRETKRLLNENRDFFGAANAVTEELGLKIPPGDPEAHTEVTLRPDGDIEVLFVYPIDNNGSSADGRIYLKDRFVFDSKEEKLKSFQRHFDFNDGGKQDSPWKDWVEKYRKAGGEVSLEKLDERGKVMAMQIGRSFGRPIHRTLSQLISANQDYFLPIIGAANDINKNWKFRKSDAQGHFTVVPQAGKLLVTLAFPLDDDKDPTNGRLFFYEKFTVDAKTGQLEKVEREWRVPNGLSDAVAAQLKDAAGKLNQQPPPDLATAGPFVQAILPEALRPLPPHFELMDGKIPLDPDTHKKGFPRELANPWKRGDLGPKVKGTQAFQETELLAVLEKEIEEKNIAKSQGWARPAINRVSSGSKETEKDPRVQKLIAILKNPDSETRATELVSFARQDLVTGEGFPITAAHIVQQVGGTETAKKDAKLQAELKRLAQLLDGSGGVGTKFEFLVPKFVDDVAAPSTLVAMGVAPFAGVAAEMSLARVFKGLAGTGRFLAGTSGLLAEAGAFTGLHRQLAGASYHDPKLTRPFGQEFISAALLFGFTRLAHGGSNLLTGRLSKKVWATEGELTHQFLASASGRIAMTPVYGRELSSGWARLAGFAHHAGGIGAMYAAGQVSQAKGWQPKNHQGTWGDLFDAAWMYAHAMVGFSLANRLTDGRLQIELLDAKLRAAGREDLPPPSLKLDPTDDAVGKGAGNFLIERIAKDKLTHLRSRLHEVKGERDGKIAEGAALANELDFAKTANTALSESNLQLEARVKELEVETEGLRERQADAARKLTGAQNDLKDAERKIQEQEIEVDSLRDQVAREIDRARKAELRATVNEQALEEARQANQKFEEGFKKLADGGKEEALKIFQEGLESANRQVGILRGGMDQKRQEIDELINKAKDAEEELKKANKELEDARAEISRIRSETSGVRQRAELAAAEADVFKTRSETAEQANESLRADLEQAARAKAELDRRLDEAGAGARNAAERIQELDTQVTSLNEQVEEAQQGITQKLTEVSTRIQELENEVTRLTDANAELDKAKRQAEARVGRVEHEKEEAAKLQRAWLGDADNKTKVATQQLAAAQARILDLEQQLAAAQADFVEDVDEGRPTIPVDLNAALVIPDTEEADPETLRPPPSPVPAALPAMPSPPLPGTVIPPPIARLSQTEVSQKLLNLARGTAEGVLQYPPSKAQYEAGEVLQIKFVISTAQLEIVEPAPKGTLTITLNLDPQDAALHLLPEHKTALEAKGQEPRRPAAKLYQAILYLDGKPLRGVGPVPAHTLPEMDDFDDLKTEPRGIALVPPSDATPAAGVDSPPSAHAVSVGVAPGGEPPRQPPVPPAPPGGEEAEEPDSSRLPTRPMQVLRLPTGAEIAVDLEAEAAELLFSPPHFDLSEATNQGSLAGLRPIEVRRNEKKVDGSPAIHEKIIEFGELVGVTDEGRGYKDNAGNDKPNEDSIGRVFSPDGSLVFGVVDGAGGSQNGKAASHLVIDTVMEEVSHGMTLPAAMEMANAKAFGAFGGRSYATGVFTQLSPPVQAGQPFMVKQHWAGDSSALHLRRVGGKWQIVFRTKEDNIARQMVDANPNRDEEAVNRTLQIHVHQHSNLVSNAIGLKGMEVRSIEDGEISPLAQVVTLPDGSKAIVAENGDLLLDFTDGLGDNYGRVQKILDLIESAGSAEEAIKILHADSHQRMELLKVSREKMQTQFDALYQKAQGKATPMALQYGGRVSIEHEGKAWWVGNTQDGLQIYPAEDGHATFWDVTREAIEHEGKDLWIDNDGTVWDLPEGGTPVDHFKTDNFGAMALGFQAGPPGQALRRGPPPLPPSRPPSPVPPPPIRRPSPLPRPMQAPVALPVVPPPLPVVPSGRASYIQGQVWFLDPRYPKIFGRSPDDGVGLGDINLSKNHFLLSWELGSWLLKDLNSHNKTALNGEVLDAGRQYPVGDGDWIRAGANQFQFHHQVDNTAALARPYNFLFSKGPAPYYLGSGTDASHPIFDYQAAPRHAEILFNGTHWLIRDNASRVGTRINGVQIMDPRNQIGAWRPLNNGDFVMIGRVQLQVSFTADGDLRLNQIILRPQAPVPEVTPAMAEIQEERRAQLQGMNQAPKGPPELQGTLLKMGTARTLKVRNTTKGAGRLYLDEAENSTYTLSIKQVMMFEDDLFLIEHSGNLGYKITNQGLSKGLRIHNSRGKDILLPRKGSDYAAFGDHITFEKITLDIQE